MFGYDSPEELMSINVSSLYKNKEDRKKFIEAIKKDWKLLNYDLKLVTKDGEDKDIILSGVIDGDSMLGTLVDITGRKRAEAILRESEEKYRTLLNNIEDGCYEVDPAGNFTFVNPSMTRILGYSEEELIGMNNRQYTDKENARKVFQAFNMVYKTGVPTRHFGWELIRKDGTKGFVGCSVSLIKDSSDNPIGFRGVLNDITERKRAEEALEEERKRLQQALDEVRTLRGIVPICASCKKIRDDKGYWSQVEKYVSDHTEAKFTHGICPDCVEKVYPEYKKQ